MWETCFLINRATQISWSYYLPRLITFNIFTGIFMVHKLFQWIFFFFNERIEFSLQSGIESLLPRVNFWAMQKWKEVGRKNSQAYLLNGAKAPHLYHWNKERTVDINTDSQSHSGRSSPASPFLPFDNKCCFNIFENTILNLKQDMSPLHFELPRGQEALLEDYAPYYRRARAHTHTHTHTHSLSLSPSHLCWKIWYLATLSVTRSMRLMNEFPLQGPPA